MSHYFLCVEKKRTKQKPVRVLSKLHYQTWIRYADNPENFDVNSLLMSSFDCTIQKSFIQNVCAGDISTNDI